MLIGGVSNAGIVCADRSHTLYYPASTNVKCIKGTVIVHGRRCNEVIPAFNALFNKSIKVTTTCNASTFVGGNAVLRPGTPFLTDK